MKDWRFRIAEQRGTLLALILFLAVFAVYLANHKAIESNGLHGNDRRQYRADRRQ